jgi:hypothetical protein
VLLAEVALIAQRGQTAGGQLGDDAPDPGGGQVMHGAGQRLGHPHDVAVGAGDDLQVHPVLAVLAGVERPVVARQALHCYHLEQLQIADLARLADVAARRVIARRSACSG